MLTLSEDELIAKYFEPLSGEGAFNLRDDAALAKNKAGHDIVTTTDTVAAGIDFFHDASPEEVAAKALRVNLSDLAAKGADAFGYLLALSLPASITEDWLAKFVAQLARDQKTYNVTLLGGDTTRAGLLSVTVIAFGHVPHGKMVMRSHAHPRNLVVVTGTIGDAALGLQVLNGKIEGNYPSLVERYAFPQPRNVLSLALQKHANATIDISDGFVGDLQKLCVASNVSAKIDLEKVPYSQEALSIIKTDPHWREVALTGGDDYEILLALPLEKWPLFEAEAKRCGVPVTVVGEIVSGEAKPGFFLDNQPRTFVRGGYKHF